MTDFSKLFGIFLISVPLVVLCTDEGLLWYFTSPVIMVFLIFILLITWLLLKKIINVRTKKLIIEKEKLETFIADMFPKNTLDELMTKGKASKVKYDFVTVMFADIHGFTKIAEVMDTEALIDELDKFFSAFDSVVEKYGIEKIKTIGDAYMCAGGIPENDRANPIMIILAGLEMMDYMRRRNSEGIKLWDIKIGIHTGSVIAGVVGQKKLSYDIWGDTVNTANHIESSGEAEKINISGTTYEFVKDFFDCSFRGKIPVKYKGELEMYFVTGIKPELCDSNGIPNHKFWEKVAIYDRD